MLDSAKDPAFKKALRSLIVFRARDFEEAHGFAMEAGKKNAEDKSISDKAGAKELRLTFCYAETLDIVGAEIELSEVWCQLSDDLTGIAPDPNRKPLQTI